MPGTLLLTAYTPDFEAMAAISVPHMKRYAAMHGFDFRAVRFTGKPQRGGAWMKIEVLRAILREDYANVFWVDLDTIMMTTEESVLAELRPGRDLYMVWHDLPQDGRFFPPHHNAGVMLVRNTEWARAFFSDVWDAVPLDHIFSDQANILKHLGYGSVLGLGPDDPSAPARAGLAELSGGWNVIVALGSDDPRILHYAGVKGPVRMVAMQHASRILTLAGDMTRAKRRVVAGLAQSHLATLEGHAQALSRLGQQGEDLRQARQRNRQLVQRLQALGAWPVRPQPA